MPIVDHASVPKTSVGPNYWRRDIAGPKEGVSCSLYEFAAGVGTGASLHFHEDDELIVVLEGTLEVRMGDDVRRVGADHTLVIPAKEHHAFSSVGPGEARILAFFPALHPFDHTTRLESSPPPSESRVWA